MPVSSTAIKVAPHGGKREESTRAYFRNFMRSYRQKERDEVRNLQKQVWALQLELQKKAHEGPLSWREIALALKEDMVVSMTTNRELKAKSERYHVALQSLYNWVISSTQVPVSPSPNTPTWRNTSLLADPVSRQYGKEWIMKQMFETTDAVFQQHQFPPYGAEITLSEVDVQFSDTCFHVIFSRQFIEEREPTYDSYLHRYRRNLLENMMFDGFKKIGPNVPVETTKYTRLHHITTSIGEFSNILTAEFNTRDRCVHVVQSITDDEAIDTPKGFMRNRAMWTDIRRMSDNRAEVRNLYIISQSFTKQGYTPLEYEAAAVYCDLSMCPEEWKQILFRRHIRTMFCATNVDRPNE